MFVKLFLMLMGLMAPFSLFSTEPIVIKLATESQLVPIYVAAFSGNDAGFDTPYLKQLEDVLRFDFSHNGMTTVAKETVERRQVASQISNDDAHNPSFWKGQSIFYIVTIKVQNKKLSARMLSVNSNDLKAADDILLSGNISKDRKLIHQLSDKIHKLLFDVDGIASTRFLYTLKVKGNNKDDTKAVSEVWEADYDGENARQVTHEGLYCVTPTYLPPKSGNIPSSFCYVAYRSSQPKIYLGNLRDGASKRLMKLSGNQLMPTINRQRNKIAFISDVTGNPDLFVQDFTLDEGAIGKPQQVFTATHATQGSPTFSPDGKKLAFVSNKDGAARIYMLTIPPPKSQLKDIRVQLLTKRNRESTSPTWSPDGSKIAYSSLTSGVRQIWVYDVNTGEERQLTQGPGHKENPTWAPNSLHLMFNSVDKGRSELYLVNLNQKEAYKVSSGPGDKRFPSW